MNIESYKSRLLKEARNAFEIACTIGENERVEVYLENNSVKVSDVLNEQEEIVYSPTKILCYRAYGHNHLEEEIKTWIDYARVTPQPNENMPLPEPTDIEKSIRELLEELSKKNGSAKEHISSFELFANLPMTLLGTIEQEIIEYWWSAKEQENGQTLALLQIQEAIDSPII